MAEIEKCPVYDGEELDPRLIVDVWEPSPYLPSGGHYFEGMSFDERGLVLRFSDGSNLRAKTYDMQIVFSGAFENVRMSALNLYQENKLQELDIKAGLGKSSPKFRAYRCKYTNYFNWCVRQNLDRENLEECGYHYIVGATDTLVEILCVDPPKVFFKGYGMRLSEEVQLYYPTADVLYDYEPPKG